MTENKGEKKRILMVDDEADITTVMKKGLEEHGGFEVDVFNDPEDALAQFRPGYYDLLTIDIRMPQMDGFELYEKLSAIDPKIRICFLTAFDIDYFEMFRQRFPHVPVRCFIKKPVSIKSLIEMVSRELNHATEA